MLFLITAIVITRNCHFNQSVIGDGTWKDLDVMSIILMKLIEPSPEIDMQAWIAWFDGLKERAAIFA